MCALPYRSPFSATAQSPTGIVPGTSVAGVALGAEINSVIARLGPVSEVRMAGTDGTMAYVFNPYGITAYVTNGVVVALTTTNSVLVDVEGIHIGTPAASLAGTLGTTSTPGAVEGLQGVLYTSLGLGFGIDHGAVAAVMVFAPLANPQQQSVPTAPSVSSHDMAAVVTAGPPTAAGTDPTPVGPSAALITTIPGVAGVTGLPDVRRLHPFSAETDYLSVQGYLRYVVYGMTQVWISSEESARFVASDASPAVP
jgi:hypothetical protein